MFEHTFIQYAFIVSLFISILCPTIGIFLVLRKYSMIGDTLSHSSLAGITLRTSYRYKPYSWSICIYISIRIIN